MFAFVFVFLFVLFCSFFFFALSGIDSPPTPFLLSSLFPALPFPLTPTSHHSYLTPSIPLLHRSSLFFPHPHSPYSSPLLTPFSLHTTPHHLNLPLPLHSIPLLTTGPSPHPQDMRVLVVSSIVLQAGQQLCGINAVFYYSTSFFEGYIEGRESHFTIHQITSNHITSHSSSCLPVALTLHPSSFPLHSLSNTHSSLPH